MATLTTKNTTTFSVNEILRIKDGIDDEFLLVTAVLGWGSYTVTRDLAGSYAADTNPIWKTGTAVVSMGVGTGTKTGFILLDSSSANSPYIDIYGRNSNTYTDYTLHGRFGWLKGITDADVGLSTTDVWGLYTDNAYIKGVIVANTGYIGGNTGWVISANYIKDVAGVTGLSSVVTGGDDIRIWAGHATPASAPFYVTEAGALVATSATISGNVTATSGTIGGFTLSSTALYAGSVATRIQLDTTSGIHLGATAFADAPFSVSLAGALIATSATLTGTINATAGKFGTATNYWSVGATGLTAVSASTDVIINWGKTDFTNVDAGFIIGYDYSSTCSKVYIGNSTNYFNWDGTTITATGHLIINGTIIDTAFTQQFTCGMAITAGNAVYVSDGVNGALLNVDGSNDNGNLTTISVSGPIYRVAQSSSTSADTYIGAVFLTLNFGGGGTLQLDLQADSAGVPSGTSLVGGEKSYTSVQTGSIYRFTAPYKCVSGTTYWIVLRCSNNDFTVQHSFGVLGKAMSYNGSVWADMAIPKADITYKLYEILPLEYIGKTSAVTGAAGCGNRYTNFIGFATETKAIATTEKTTVAGVITGLTGLTPGPYYLSDTAGAIATSAGTNSRKVGIAISATALEITNIW